MSTSITQQAIRVVSKEVFSKLSSMGFKRKGVHLYRQIGDLYHAINFQASQWGSASDGQFTVNLIVTSPALYTTWVGRPFPANPASALFPVQMRIGSLLPEKKDFWWHVDAATDNQALALDVASKVECVSKDFFSLYESDEKLLEQLRLGICPGCTKPLTAVVHALVANSLGFKDEAILALKVAVSESQVSSFSEKVVEFSHKLGLELM